MGVLADVGKVVDIADKVDKLWKELNTPRGVVCEVHNWTNEVLKRTHASCSSGGFKEPPDLEIPPRKVEIFSASSAAGSVFTGAVGEVKYAGNKAEFTITFDNPWAGHNSGNIEAAGDHSDAYKVNHVIGNGNVSKNKYDIAAQSEHVFSGGLSHAMWTHGHSIEIETPEALESCWRAGMFAQITGKPNSKNWVHYSIPTPVIVPEAIRLRVGSVMVRYRALGDAKITKIHIYDGEKTIASYNEESLSSSGWAWPRFEVPNTPEVHWGVGASMQIETGSSQKEHSIAIASVGCDFIQGVFL